MRCLCEDFSQCKWNKTGLFCECGGGFFGDHCECKSETSHCNPNPCVHGCCIEDGDSYSCQCKSGWEGQHCDTDINECLSSPCGVGYCIDELNKFKCECPKDYIDNCQGIDRKLFLDNMFHIYLFKLFEVCLNILKSATDK
ncbi:delta-like protein 1 [Ruditapes philippinarum]|uniref:delta-like protein 1 n=1 Tax=Ruditapes philippinarum TaxID=129788 RepID=UPI00295A7195|nr:delta-like protein 1 [Ruditapes philippinarum]